MTVHLIDFNQVQIYEAGAVLITLLAYPGATRSDEERRSQLHASLCAYMLRASYEVDPDLATLPQIIKPIYPLQTERDCRKSLRSLPRLLRDRMVAARMAYPFLKGSGERQDTGAPGRFKTIFSKPNGRARTQRCRTSRCRERRDPDLAPEPAGHPVG